MTNYAVELYATPAATETALELLETTTTFTVIPYYEASQAKFIVITPACNAPM